MHADTPEPVLSVEFAPVRPGFHLYSVDLPKTGVDGIGRPTRVEVGGALTAVGRSTADLAVVPLRLEGVATSLPVYPDGPVTVRQAVRVGSPGNGDVFVSYAACSRTTCLEPISRQRVDVALPAIP
ncbi:MAG: hypothetical protein M3Y71_16590 [Actinomycetota bacterium]|nr:hypothetical protein [Actinomycetota bacterium]